MKSYTGNSKCMIEEIWNKRQWTINICLDSKGSYQWYQIRGQIPVCVWIDMNQDYKLTSNARWYIDTNMKYMKCDQFNLYNFFVMKFFVEWKITLSYIVSTLL